MVIPKHMAIILDGNGRWAQKKGLPRSEGHKAGCATLKKIGLYAFEKGVEVLSVFAFSTENFKRSKEEVSFLMNLFLIQFQKEMNIFKENNIKVVFSGRKKVPLSTKFIKIMKQMEKDTENNTKGIFNICLNYGAKTEIIDATKSICEDVVNKKLNIDDLTEKKYNNYLYNDLPPIDLLVRTSGEMRISNFMLWQAAYAEFYFPDVMFPDFNESEFDKAIEQFSSRDRRFGGVKNEKESN